MNISHLIPRNRHLMLFLPKPSSSSETANKQGRSHQNDKLVSTKPQLSEAQVLLESALKKLALAQEKIDILKKDNEDLMSQIEIVTFKQTESHVHQNLLKKIEKTDSIAQKLKTELYEIRQRFKRQLNLVIYNLPEDHSANRNRCRERQADLDSIWEMIEYAGIRDIDTFTCVRLGNELPSNLLQPRPLLVEFENVRGRRLLLAKSVHIGKEFGCYVKPDLSKKQRTAEKEVWKELKIRRANGEKVRMFRSKIVQIT